MNYETVLSNHLEEVGLRVSKEAIQSELVSSDEEKDESVLFDVALRRMTNDINSKRDKFSAERLDGVGSSKFTLKVEGQDLHEYGATNDTSDGMYHISLFTQNRFVDHVLFMASKDYFAFEHQDFRLLQAFQFRDKLIS